MLNSKLHIHAYIWSEIEPSKTNIARESTQKLWYNFAIYFLRQRKLWMNWPTCYKKQNLKFKKNNITIFFKGLCIKTFFNFLHTSLESNNASKSNLNNLSGYTIFIKYVYKCRINMSLKIAYRLKQDHYLFINYPFFRALMRNSFMNIGSYNWW